MIGHILRNERLLKAIIEDVEGPTGRGRPRKKYMTKTVAALEGGPGSHAPPKFQKKKDRYLLYS